MHTFDINLLLFFVTYKPVTFIHQNLQETAIKRIYKISQEPKTIFIWYKLQSKPKPIMLSFFDTDR